MSKEKLQAIKNRSSMNIKSGRVMIETKDRDWLFATIENLLAEKDGDKYATTNTRTN